MPGAVLVLTDRDVPVSRRDM